MLPLLRATSNNMPRKSKPKSDHVSNPLKPKQPQPHSSITTSSFKRRKISHGDDSTPKNPESAQAPSEVSEVQIPDTTSKPSKNALYSTAPLPPPPTSVSSTYILLPPEADDTAIREKWDMHTISLGGAGAKIEAKVRQVLNVLKSHTADQKEREGETNAATGEKSLEKSHKKHTIVALTARTSAGNKCISVAEIVKRDLLAKGVNGVWQYTGCWTRLETYVSPKANDISKAAPNGTVGTDHDSNEGQVNGTMEDEEETAFETMQMEDRKLVRNAVCLVIYLAMESIPRLKELYGEQIVRPEL